MATVYDRSRITGLRAQLVSVAGSGSAYSTASVPVSAFCRLRLVLSLVRHFRHWPHSQRMQ
jgi:hypothetical protein